MLKLATEIEIMFDKKKTEINESCYKLRQRNDPTSRKDMTLENICILDLF